tara:strand:- start:50 stop:466 length:417 start_codon:yes stop_codon:yes gene_type:complete
LEFSNVFPTSKEVGSASPGKVMLFQYSAKYAQSLPFYDRNPLCYIVAVEQKAFYGVNLHYTRPFDRMGTLEFIDAGGDFSKLAGYNKYLKSYVNALFLDLSATDRDKAIGMGLQDFVRDLGSVEISIPQNAVNRYLRK